MRSRHSKHRPGRCGGGPSATTTSAASVRSGEQVPPPTRGGTARRCPLRQAERNPADVAALGTARVLLHRAPGDRLRVDLPTLEAADARKDGEDRYAGGCLHTRKDTSRRRNL